MTSDDVDPAVAADPEIALRGALLAWRRAHEEFLREGGVVAALRAEAASTFVELTKARVELVEVRRENARLLRTLDIAWGERDGLASALDSARALVAAAKAVAADWRHTKPAVISPNMRALIDQVDAPLRKPEEST